MKNLAIITARSGSKGLVNKNIKLLNNTPLIAYTIQAAIKSGKFSKIYVSTDSVEYANIAEKYGAIATPLRSEELSSDSTGSIEVIESILKMFENDKYETFCLLQPTSPFRKAHHIVEAYDKFENLDAKSIVSMKKADSSPNIINTLSNNNSINDFVKINQENYRRQDEEFYQPNGAIFIAEIEEFLKTKSFYGESAYAYIMEKKDSIDIDDKYDFMLAEIIIKEEK